MRFHGVLLEEFDARGNGAIVVAHAAIAALKPKLCSNRPSATAVAYQRPDTPLNGSASDDEALSDTGMTTRIGSRTSTTRHQT